MKADFEKVPAVDCRHAIHLLVREDAEFAFRWHFHPEYELTLIVESQGQRLVGNSVADYAANDLVLLGPNLPHSWRSGPAAPNAGQRLHRAIVVQFRLDFLGTDFMNLDEVQPIKALLDQAANGLAFGHLPQAADVMESMKRLPALSPARQLAGFIDILARLAEVAHDAQRLSHGPYRPTYRAIDQSRIDAICTYLEEHYADGIDHTTLNQIVGLNRASLCRFFKHATGRTITAYVNELRVAAAVRLLVETEQSVLAIGYAVGFGNHANFCRHFARLKRTSPGRLRREFCGPK